MVKGLYMGVSKNRGKTPKMDGVFHGKPYEQMDDVGVFQPPLFLVQHPYRKPMEQDKSLSDVWLKISGKLHGTRHGQ